MWQRLVRIGSTDIREYTLESLMDQISMVFQNVYLFADTIENNIRFGKPDATTSRLSPRRKKPVAMILFPLCRMALAR